VSSSLASQKVFTTRASANLGKFRSGSNDDFFLFGGFLQVGQVLRG